MFSIHNTNFWFVPDDIKSKSFFESSSKSLCYIGFAVSTELWQHWFMYYFKIILFYIFR